MARWVYPRPMHRALEAACGLVDRLNAALGRVTAWAVLGIVITGAANAALRHIGRWSHTTLAGNAGLDIQWMLFALCFYTGAAYTLQRDAHVRVDVLSGRWGARTRRWVDVIGGIVCTVPFAWFLIWVGSPAARAAWRVWEGSPDPGGLPRWPVKVALLGAAGLLLAQAIVEVLRAAGLAAPRAGAR